MCGLIVGVVLGIVGTVVGGMILQWWRGKELSDIEKRILERLDNSDKGCLNRQELGLWGPSPESFHRAIIKLMEHGDIKYEERKGQNQNRYCITDKGRKTLRRGWRRPHP